GKKRKAIFICIDPDLLVYDKQKDIAKFKSLGFKHMGFNDYFENRQPRFTYNLKLNNLETIAHNFHPTTRKIYHRGNVYDLEITKGIINDITNFSSLMKETGRRNNAIFFSEEYYKSFYQLFNMHNMSDIYIAKINMDHLKNIYKTKIAELNYKLLKSKNDNNKNDLDNQLNKYKKEFMEIKEIKDKDLILSSIITVKTNNKVFTVHGGNANNLRFLNANYWLYFKIIEDSLNDNFKEIDFFGTIGNDNKCNSGYGIHLFKRRLGGDKLEYIGEFDLILNKFLYFLYKKIYSKLKHRK
ncbi:MAG: peptidoglycan bridge formation glycyltransferase FemA/FemB family protein, partial [Bacilli bacterium]